MRDREQVMERRQTRIRRQSGKRETSDKQSNTGGDDVGRKVTRGEKRDETLES